MTAKMKMMMHKTKVKLPRAPTVLPMMEMSKLSVGHDFANLNTRSCFFFKERTNLLVFFFAKKKKKKRRTNRKERRTERPETPSSPSSRSDKKTMMKSKMFHPSLK